MINKIRASEFNRHVAAILSGSTLAQLIPLISEPILVRFFTPVEFGILALFLAVATIFSSVATARYEMAIVLPKRDELAFAKVYLVNPASIIPCFTSSIESVCIIVARQPEFGIF